MFTIYDIPYETHNFAADSFSSRMNALTEHYYSFAEVVVNVCIIMYNNEWIQFDIGDCMITFPSVVKFVNA